MTQSVAQISADEAKVVLDTDHNVIFLDVRTPAEYAKGRIPGSINIPLDTLSTEIHSQLPDTSKKVVVYCFSSSRSDMAIPLLQQMGYTNAVSLVHGLLEWGAKKYPFA